MTEENDVTKATCTEDCVYTRYEYESIFIHKKKSIISASTILKFWEESEIEDDAEQIFSGRIAQKIKFILESIDMCHDATGDEESEALMQMIKKVMTCCQELLLTLAELKLPIVRPRWCDLTDAGPGVSNFKVKFRDAELYRIFNSDHRICVHRSRGDSGQNEAERTNSAIGDAVVDAVQL
ncbi:Transient receptor potential cation channel subfamily A member 1 [Paramuricea clavata]|uniref:Transient receptor potential cation channel subfamily A member 1 n=1 Tax=Paramuricea clavata TaxID=317549 RepID=A0A6S7GHZ0_PARCT|nr:Transient receptor potential cation channel subfamily A member 1 [Paramuricea clavata]